MIFVKYKLKILLVAFMYFQMNFAYANKNIDEVVVNFFTLASNEQSFDNRKISIRGWIAFYEYPNQKTVLLFQSQSAMEEFRRDEAIEVFLSKDSFVEAKEYLNNKNVRVYAVYQVSTSLGAFGHLKQIRDIDIVNTSK